MGRQESVCAAFTSLSDTLVPNYDVIDVVHRLSEFCVELLGANAVGLLLADRHDRLVPLASSQEHPGVLELFALQTGEGPILECFHTGASINFPDLTAAPRRWPGFATRADRLGFASAYTLPLRRRSETIGAMQLLHTAADPLTTEDLTLAQAMADVVTVGILQARAVRHERELVEQLRTALDTRVEINQATGVLAERAHIDTHEAVIRLRHYARAHRRPLREVSHAVLTEQLDPTHLAELAHPWS